MSILEDKEPTIKRESTSDDSPFITTDYGETIDLLSDDENEDTMTAILQKPAPASKPSPKSQRVSATPVGADVAMDTVPNFGTAALEAPTLAATHDQIRAVQKRLADKFRANQAAKPVDDDLSVAASPIPELEVDDIESRYKLMKSEYDRGRKSNSVSIEQEILMIKLEAEYSAHQRKAEADRQYEQVLSEDEGLFVATSDVSVARPALEFSENEEEEPVEKAKKRKHGPTKGEGGPTKKAKTAATKKAQKALKSGLYDGEVDDAVQAIRTKAPKAAKPRKAPAKTKPKGKKQNVATMTNLQSVLGADVFRDTAAVANLPSQPKFKEYKKGGRDAALKQLVASVPEESTGVAKHDVKFLANAMKAFTGQGACAPTNDGSGHFTVRGMRTSLKPYQVMGVGFMRQRENSSVNPKGGLLCDEMGLGKTIMMLANIVNGRPAPGSKLKATLIVAAPALIAQWDQEIRAHCQTRRESKHGIGFVIHHRAGNRINSNDNRDLLATADIVLTTYHEVCRSYPKCVPPSELVTAAQKEAYWKELWENERGLLHRIPFLRVVLDEASAIKNHKSHTSLSCRALDARHYWAISGTPIQNSLQEFYPYFKFLREPCTGTFKIFKQNFVTGQDPTGKERLNAFLRKVMIRRTHLDKMFNAKLLDLPKPHQNTLWLEFNDIERQVYDIVRKRFIARINSMAMDGSVNKKFSGVWNMVLRLRQITSNCLLVFNSCLELLEREDFEKLNQITAADQEGNDDGVELLLHLRHVLRQSKASQTLEGGISNSVLTDCETVAIGAVDVGQSADGEVGKKHGLSFRFQKYLDAIKGSSEWENAKARSVCCGCRQPPDNPYVTSCSHIFCLSCLEDLQHLAARRGRDLAKCAECGETYTSTRPCEEGFEAMEARPTSTSPVDEPATKAPSKKKAKEDQIDWLGLKGEVLPSAKTLAVKAQVLEWIDDDKDVKIIIYTQWIPMIRILSKVALTEGWDHCCYSGQQSHEQRAQALSDFSTMPSKRLLIASLRCGGMGLNITAASKVILIDPWWNSAIEQQAFCRVFRIGQERETSMLRLVVKNTIDQAMMNLKDKKNEEIDAVMDSSKLQEKLDVRDLMKLFGNEVGDDEEGRPFIFADADSGDERLRVLPDSDDEQDALMADEA